MAVTLRPATLADVPHFERWDREPHVIAATSDDADAYVAFEGAVWAEEIENGDPASIHYVAEIDGRPIGAMQVIDPALERTHYWGKDCASNLRAMDIWIGEANCLGKGYGTEMMTLAIDGAFADASVEAVIIDPLTSNTNAHRFYRRLGFQPVERRDFDGDDCLVHKLTRADWRKGN
ncbi:MAG TPA: GNAT family N-acetyltransferase [Henriciella marina]|uniref:GNAT family N-acetyltransferase n=1 Tax=Henriciella sp. TaxID=1968823 RepID=UPI0017EDF999|nr:GNAT family N-acetyltransferase [Henriciella sp.]HIG22468.1 GNAT family N-acetyltransferase [Henriciella sp.]HIK64018.1 GNAT family N-acetyltransferase [Henriciella marina]